MQRSPRFQDAIKIVEGEGMIDEQTDGKAEGVRKATSKATGAAEGERPLGHAPYKGPTSGL